MKIYFKTLLVIIIVSLISVIAINVYYFKELYTQALNSFLNNYNISWLEKTKPTIDENFSKKLNIFSSDLYTVYYPDNYILSFKDNLLIFYEKLNIIAKLRIIDLKSTKIESIQELYLFSEDSEFIKTSDFSEFYNKYLLKNDNFFKVGDKIFISSRLESINSEVEDIEYYSEYTVNSHQEINQYISIGFTEINDTKNSIFFFSSTDTLIIAELSTNSIEDLNYLLNLILLINKFPIN